MKTRQIVLVALVAVSLVACVLVYKKEQGSTKVDPSVLPTPSRDFDNWSKTWEKQR